MEQSEPAHNGAHLSEVTNENGVTLAKPLQNTNAYITPHVSQPWSALGAEPCLHSEPLELHQIVPYELQVAGHGTDKKGNIGLLQGPAGIVYKEVQPPPKGLTEVRFYHQLLCLRAPNGSTPESESESDAQQDRALLALRSWIPRYYGFFHAHTAHLSNQIHASRPSDQLSYYIKLEDVLAPLASPNIIDLKMGRQSYEPTASEQKKQEEISKYKYREEVGFLTSGMRIFEHESRTNRVYDRNFGRQLTPEQVVHVALRTFFDLPPNEQPPSASGSESSKDCHVSAAPKVSRTAGSLHSALEQRRRLMKEMVGQLRSLFEDYERQTRYHLYAASVLLAFDAAALLPLLSRALLAHTPTPAPTHSTIAAPQVPVPPQVVRLIDFTHAIPAQPPDTTDDNVLYGLGKLITYIERLEAECSALVLTSESQ